MLAVVWCLLKRVVVVDDGWMDGWMSQEERVDDCSAAGWMDGWDVRREEKGSPREAECRL
jgi:hypothetical protein